MIEYCRPQLQPWCHLVFDNSNVIVKHQLERIFSPNLETESCCSDIQKKRFLTNTGRKDDFAEMMKQIRFLRN